MKVNQELYNDIVAYIAETIRTRDNITYIHYLWQHAMNNKQDMPMALKNLVQDAVDDYCRDNNVCEDELYELGLILDDDIAIAEALDMLDNGDRIADYFGN